MIRTLTSTMKEDLEKFYIENPENPITLSCQESTLNTKDKVYIHQSGLVFTEEYLDMEFHNYVEREYLLGYNDALLGYYCDSCEQRIDKGLSYLRGFHFAISNETCPKIDKHYI